MYTYAIGDIHGMLSSLEELFDRLPLDPANDTLAFLGDYIDRGPDSHGVIEFILTLMEEGFHVVCLRGNHEVMLTDHINGRADLLFLCNGGEATLDSYRRASGGASASLPSDHREFIRDLLPYYEMDDFILVHAGLRPGVALCDQSETDLFWIRSDFIYSNHDFGKRVVFGHTPFSQPYVDKYKIGIDTGAVYGNRLSCVRLPDMKFFSA